MTYFLWNYFLFKVWSFHLQILDHMWSNLRKSSPYMLWKLFLKIQYRFWKVQEICLRSKSSKKFYNVKKMFPAWISKIYTESAFGRYRQQNRKKIFNLWFSKTSKALENLATVKFLTNFGKMFGILSEWKCVDCHLGFANSINFSCIEASFLQTYFFDILQVYFNKIVVI